MSTETRPSMSAVQPSEKPTVELEKPPAWAIALSEKVAKGFASVDARFDAVESNVAILVDDKKTVNERLSRIETWKENEVTARLNANSERVRGESSVNLKQDSVIAEVVTRLDAVEANQKVAAAEREKTAGYVKEIRDTVVTAATSTSKFFSHPKVVFVGKVIFAAAVAYSALHGIKVVP